jgi:hypothetical protein
VLTAAAVQQQQQQQQQQQYKRQAGLSWAQDRLGLLLLVLQGPQWCVLTACGKTAAK